MAELNAACHIVDHASTALVFSFHLFSANSTESSDSFLVFGSLVSRDCSQRLRQIPVSDADKLLILFYSSERQPKQDAAEERSVWQSAQAQEVNLP
jgi:hypothetical protein